MVLSLNDVQKIRKRVFHRLGDKEKNVFAHSRGMERNSYYNSRRDTEICYQSSRSKETKAVSEKHRHKREYSRRMKAVSESEGSAGGHWKSKPKKQKSSVEEDLSQPWVCEESDLFTPQIHYIDFSKARMPSHIKTYDGSEDPKDYLKIFQAAAKTKCWAMPAWCHMFNSTLTGNVRVWFDDLPKESINSYDDLRKAFLENYLQQKKCIKDPVEIHNIKQRDGESTEEFVWSYKLKCRDSMDEMMSVTTTFLIGEVATFNRERKKSFPSWKQQEAGQKQNFKRGNFQNEQRMERKQDRFTLLKKTPKEILALDKGMFKPPPPMTTTIEKRNASKFCEFHGEVGHTTNECMHLKRQMEEMLKAGKLSHLNKELKQNHGKDHAKTAKKGETSGKDKPLAILMIQPWKRIVRQRITQTFSPESVISFPTLGEEDGTEGPMIIEVKWEDIACTACTWTEISGAIIWHLGQISLLVKIGDEEHSTSTWMNFMVIRSPSPYNGIIGRPGVRNIRAIPSVVHGMLKFPVAGGIVTLQSSRIIQLECSMISEPGVPRSVINQVTEEKIQKPADMTGVPRHIAKHRLNVREGCLHVRQKKRGQAPKRNKAIGEEVKKLVEADIMKEVHYHSWLSNPLMVKKHDESERMCVDFKDLNKACPKDGYLLPEIDWKVESLYGYLYKCFLDAYKGYHQIKMAEEDEEKMAFVTSQGIFWYKVDANGLRVYPDKMEAVLNLSSLKCLKDAQKLNGKLASLNRFLSKPAKKSLPFFKTLKKCTKKIDFQWTAEAEMAFKGMKQLIAKLPILTAPKEKEELIMYVTAAKEAISAVLMTERDMKQVPIYFVRREHGIQYRPRKSVKGQILADFIVEHSEDDTPDTSMEDSEELPDPWILFTDGSSSTVPEPA
nr:hypothetical protein [Tanacetum cinerariifolium]